MCAKRASQRLRCAGRGRDTEGPQITVTPVEDPNDPKVSRALLCCAGHILALLTDALLSTSMSLHSFLICFDSICRTLACFICHTSALFHSLALSVCNARISRQLRITIEW